MQFLASTLDVNAFSVSANSTRFLFALEELGAVVVAALLRRAFA